MRPRRGCGASRRAALGMALLLVAAGCASSQPASVTTDQVSPGAATPATSPTVVVPEAEPTDEPSDSETVANSEPTQTVLAEPEPTTTPVATAEPAPATPTPNPTSAPSETATPAAARCSAGLSGSPVGISTVVVDIDGDGADDLAMVYGTDEGLWRIRVETSVGESLDSPLELPIGSAATPAIVGGADVDGQAATDEIFAVVGAGASTILVAIVIRDGCDLVQIGVDGVAQTFAIGGSVSNIGGLQCVDSNGDGATESFMAWTGAADFESSDGQYVLRGIEYRLRGTELIQIGITSTEANISEADFLYGQLSCGSVNL